MSEGALVGCGVVITRPIEQARKLAELVQQQDGRPILFPLLSIAPLENDQALISTLQQLKDCDWAIFISSNAVQQSMSHLLEHYPQLPPNLRFAAIGPSTADELRRFGVLQVLTPQERYDSESLLSLPEMQTVKNKRIMIFRGVGGRELLAEQLQARGATVHFAECYRRINPQQDAGDLPRLWQNKQLHAWVVTSSEALRNLIKLAGDAEWLRNTLVCVNHPRIAELAQQYDLRTAIAKAPGDEGMLQCLIEHYQGYRCHE